MPDLTSFGGVGLLMGTLTAVYILGSMIYNATLHPLAGFPGPWYAPYTRLPYWIAVIKGRQPYYIQGLHSRYGSVVRFSANSLSYTDPQAWKDIFDYKRGAAECLKAPEAHPKPMNGVPNILTVGTEDHRRIRRIFSSAFSSRSLKQQEPLFRRHVDLLKTKLTEVAGQPVDMVQMFNFTTFDVMGDLTFGQPLGLLQNAKFSPWVEAVFNSVRFLPWVQIVQYYPILLNTLSWLEPAKIKKIRTGHFRHTADRVDMRIQRGSDQPDIWNLVMSAGEGEGLTLNEMYSNAELFMLAGTETSATCLSFLLYSLLVDPAKMKTLTEELHDHFSNSDVSMEGLANLKYLNACIQETMRMYPPVPLGVPRYIPEGGRVIAGKWIAPGTRVSVHQFASSRSPANFKDPDTFAPERWLGDAAYANDKRAASQPFSAGPRNCLGQNMAWHEMRLTIASVLASFDIELCTGPEWPHQQVFGFWLKKPLICRLSPKAQ